jgi:hypothetical protein
MFRVKDVVVGLLDNMNGEYRFYEIVKIHEGEASTLYDIRAIKTGITYCKVMLPESYYKKLDRIQ